MTSSPAMTEMLTFCVGNLRVLMGFLSSDVGAIHLLSQNPDDTDEEEEIHLPAQERTALHDRITQSCI